MTILAYLVGISAFFLGLIFAVDLGDMQWYHYTMVLGALLIMVELAWDKK